MITLALAITNLILFVVLIFKIKDLIQDMRNMQDRYGNALQAQDGKIYDLQNGLKRHSKPHTSKEGKKRIKALEELSASQRSNTGH